MLSLAGLQPGEHQKYETLLRDGELQYPLLASLRVRVVRKGAKEDSAFGLTQDADASGHGPREDISVVVVEAVPQDISPPNTSMTDVHAMFATLPPCGDRLAVSPLLDLTFSPFHNLLANDCPVDKALVLLQSTQKSVGKQIAGGFRVLTNGVSDATNTDSEDKYGIIAYCTVEASPMFMFASASLTLAVISKVAAPQKAEHKADLLLDAMERVDPAQTDGIVRMLQHLQRHGPAARASAQASHEKDECVSPAWEQRKCRRMGRYPTIA